MASIYWRAIGQGQLSFTGVARVTHVIERSSSAPHHGDIKGVAVSVGAGSGGLLGRRGCPAAPERPLHRRVRLRDGLHRHWLRAVQHCLGALVAPDGCHGLLHDISEGFKMTEARDVVLAPGHARPSVRHAQQCLLTSTAQEQRVSGG